MRLSSPNPFSSPVDSVQAVFGLRSGTCASHAVSADGGDAPESSGVSWECCWPVSAWELCEFAGAHALDDFTERVCLGSFESCAVPVAG